MFQDPSTRRFMHRRRSTQALVAVAFGLIAAGPLAARAQRRPALDSAALSDIATLLMLEDTRSFDSLSLARVLASNHPEVRRRAALSIGRINDKRGVALLRARPLDADTAIV